MAETVINYLKKIESNLKTGAATEHTHRPALKELVEAVESGIEAVNEPRRIECGAPDLSVSRKTGHGPVTLGYIEAKDVGANLHEVEKSEQLKRYRKSLPNLILTDYLEFRWYVDGELRETVRAARTTAAQRLAIDKDGSEKLAALLSDFVRHKPEPVRSPRELALRMARLTHIIRDIITTSFETEKASNLIRDLHNAFKTTLIPDLAPDRFADMFAQTLAYGLFAARCNHRGREPFRRIGAAKEIPKTNPFLRDLFETITGTKLDDEPFAGFVDDLAQLLDQSEIDTILAYFGRRTKKEDPVIHFYETFLAAYDPAIREMRGVYFTPEPVVSYIVRSVDHLLKEKFGCSGGLADTDKVEYERETTDTGKRVVKKETGPRVLILDPACGTGTFLYSVIDHIRDQFLQSGNAGMWRGYVRNHLLPRLFGFELLMAPYAVAHFKLGMQLAAQDMKESLREKWAYDFSGNERLGIYLTNTLEEAEKRSQDLFGSLRIISDEANAAAAVKRDLPIMVVMGNPPYSGHSANRSEVEVKIPKGEKYFGAYEMIDGKVAAGSLKTATKDLTIRKKTFIGEKLLDYYVVDGEWLKERNPKWLQDDYVKFIRFGQWRIEKTGAGVLAFITNHGYLDNPTFRGMRQQLMNNFSEIFIVDLHGSSRKKERAPGGGKDENVFDIQQGVTIGIFVKEPGKSGPAKMRHAELWGIRESKDTGGGKYGWLLSHDINDTKWTKLKPKSPFYFFKPSDGQLEKEYIKGWNITEIMPVNSVGIVTSRDKLTIKIDQKNVLETVKDFSSLTEEKAREKYNLGEDIGDWKVASAQEDIRKNGIEKKFVIPLMYRPFDIRFTYYTGQSRGFICRPRYETMSHLLAGENIALITSRLTKGETFKHAQVTRNITEVICMSPKTSNNGFVFPLYLYPKPEYETNNQKNFIYEERETGKDGRAPNFSAEFISDVENKLKLKFISDGTGDLKKTIGPEDIFHYIYAVLYSPKYRERYAEFLKIDFPRVPVTSDRALFRKLAGLGDQLVQIHLIESPLLNDFVTIYPVPGKNEVEKGHPRYLAPGDIEPGTTERLKKGRVYINKTDSKLGKQGQYFEGVDPEVWNFHIGGYRVCEKWLKDRRERLLSYDDLTHYQKIIVSIKETIGIMAEIDGAILDFAKMFEE